MRYQLGVLLAITVLAVVSVGPVYAGQDAVTYYEDVLPILQENCQSCHRPSGKNITGVVAPMSLMTFEETRPWARAIARKVEAHEMPPWYASAPVGVFDNERRLTDQEVDTIVAWVNAGAPGGDRALSPAPRVFPEEASGGWTLGKPDFVVSMEPFLVGDDVYDLQPSFSVAIPDEFIPEEGLWVRGWEGRAGANGNLVHHMCSSVQSPGAEVVDDEEAQAEDEGATADRGGSLGCIASGTEGRLLPDGWGLFIERGSSVRFGMHYNKPAGPDTAFYNAAEMGFFINTEPVKYAFKNDAIGNRGFQIPSHRENYRVGAARMFDKDTYIVNWWPHAHLRAVASRYTATYPDGTEELLLDVPAYDQSWQETYWYQEPKLLPKGTVVDVSFWYDNTSERGIRRGFDADLAVGHAARTNDEMALGFVGYAEAVEPIATNQSQN